MTFAIHINKGKDATRCLRERIEYATNPEKTNGGALVTSYGCNPETAAAEFNLMRSSYLAKTGRLRNDEVIAYHLRQSFKPGEITPEEANRVGQEVAQRFLKGKHSFIVATHSDKEHIQ